MLRTRCAQRPPFSAQPTISPRGAANVPPKSQDFGCRSRKGWRPAALCSGQVSAGLGVTSPPVDPESKSPAGANRPFRTNGRSGGAYDLVVIGAGSAGFSAAITAADQGAQVALIGSGTIGGTCVNIGCVPSKTLIRAAETLHNARVAARFAGITAEAELTDWRGTVRQKDALVSELRQAKYIDLLPAYNGIAYRDGPARLVDGGVEVEWRAHCRRQDHHRDRRAAGSARHPWHRDRAVSDQHDGARPRGAAALAARHRRRLHRRGARPDVRPRRRQGDARLPVPPAARGRARDRRGADGLFSGGRDHRASPASLTVRSARLRAALRSHVLRDGQDTTIDADQVLVTTGRAPNIEGLGLAEHGIAVSPKGGIVVDDRMRTTRAGIYAAGDVTGRDQFVYMAAYGAKLAAKNALNGDSLRYDNSAMPAIVFTDPQVASVGLTEAAARTAGHSIRVSTIGLDQVPRALAARDTRGLIKLVADAASGRLLGAHILAPEGADSIQTAALAIRQGLTIDDLADTIFPYLTTVEGLKLAACRSTRTLRNCRVAQGERYE